MRIGCRDQESKLTREVLTRYNGPHQIRTLLARQFREAYTAQVRTINPFFADVANLKPHGSANIEAEIRVRPPCFALFRLSESESKATY